MDFPAKYSSNKNAQRWFAETGKMFVKHCLLPVLFVSGLALPVLSHAQEPTSYTSFNEDVFTRYAYVGRNVAFLLPTTDYDSVVIDRILENVDKAYDFYELATGREPSPLARTTYEGRLTIAVIDDTCGAACGYLGATGIEMRPLYWDKLYDGVNDREEYNQVVFYELGRNFWFYSDQLRLEEEDFRGLITTAFAIALRFQSMDFAGVDGAPFRDQPFDEWFSDVLKRVEIYENTSEYTFNNTMRIGENPIDFSSASGLFAAFYLRLSERFGEDFVLSFWKNVGELPPAETTEDAVGNFVTAASQTSGKNLFPLFSERWRFPVPTSVAWELNDFGGLWYDPALSGSGFNIVQFNGGLAVYYYGYTSGGERLWLAGNRTLDTALSDSTSVELIMLYGRGGTTALPVPPGNLTRWGTLVIEPQGCDRISFSLKRDSGAETVFDARPLVLQAKSECYDVNE